MLIVNIDDFDNTLTLINISKSLGKAKCYTYPFNCLIKNYNPPLPLPSFAKLNDTYIIKNVAELKYFLYKNGEKLNREEFKNIISRRMKYIKNNTIEQVYLSITEVLEMNTILENV